MNKITLDTIKQKIKKHSVELQNLLADYLTVKGEAEDIEGFLMLALDEVIGNEDPTFTYAELFAPDYSDEDLSERKETIHHNRKALKNYIEFNQARTWL